MCVNSLIKVGASMLQQRGLTSSCCLAASATQGHTQIGGSVMLRQFCPGVAACHKVQMLQAAALRLGAASSSYQAQGRQPALCHGLSRVAAMGASTAPFQLPGTLGTHCLHSRAGHSVHPRQFCSTPLQGADQQQPSPQQQSSVAVRAMQSPASSSVGLSRGPAGQKKRPADMDHFERLEYLHDTLYELYDEWDLQELLTLPPDSLNKVFRPMCPECQGGSKQEDCFAVTVTADSHTGKPEAVLWNCHRGTCGFHGGVSVWGQMRTPAQAGQQPSGSFSTVLLPDKQPQQAQGLQARQQLQVQQAWQQLLSAQQQQRRQESVPQSPQQALQQLLPPRQPAAGRSLVPVLPQGAGTSTPRQLGSEFQDLSPALLQWLQGRGISRATLDRNHVRMEERYCGALNERVDHIAFPYYRDGVVVNVKYRALPKHFTQVKGGQQIFYGYDDAKGADEVIVVEGELDKLAVEEALMQVAASAAKAAPVSAGAEAGEPMAFMASPEGGRRAVISVPAGAPSRAAGPATSQERKFKFVDDCQDILRAAKRVVLAVDTDGPGLALASELVRRIGPERCLTVKWPVDRKDANEVLLEDGPEVVKACLDAAEHVPIRGLFHFDAFRKEVWLLWSQGVKGLGMGFETGWPSVDKHYRVVPGELTIVTGLSNSGKSEWLDALTVNLAEHYGWRFALCSLENTVTEHGRKLIEKYTRKAFFADETSHDVAKMDFGDVADGIVFVDEHFHLILPPSDDMPSIDYILDKARAAVLRYGIKGLVIDPYNELDTRRGRDMSETEYVSCMLSKVKRFAQHYECHVWFVAHPRTQRGLGVGGGSSTLSAPSMYDISGSAHFINKADNGIVVHRPYTGARAVAEGLNTALTQILVRKVRNKVAGSIGDVTLSYNRATGRYTDVEA